METDPLPKESHFTEEGLENIVAFGGVLRSIHNRLIIEGYVVKDGKITPPPGVKEVMKYKKAKSD